MANIVIATPILSDPATLTTAGTVAGSLPLANLKSYRPSRVCRWTSLSNISVIADLGSAQALSLAALLFCNGTPAATWRVRIATTEGDLTAAPLYDSGTLPLVRHATHVFPSVTGRWVRLDVADAANPAGFFEAGRLYIANAWQPALNVAEGWQLGFEDDSEVARTLDGGMLVMQRRRRRLLRASFRYQTEAELYNRAYNLITARGLGQDLLVIRDPDSSNRAQQTVYGLLAETAPIVHAGIGLYDWDLTVRELI